MRRAQNADTRPMHSKNIGCPQQFPPLVQFCTGYRIRVASERNKRAKKSWFSDTAKIFQRQATLFRYFGTNSYNVKSTYLLLSDLLPFFSQHLWLCFVAYCYRERKEHKTMYDYSANVPDTSPHALTPTNKHNFTRIQGKRKKKNFLCVVDVCLAWPAFKASSIFFFSQENSMKNSYACSVHSDKKLCKTQM